MISQIDNIEPGGEGQGDGRLLLGKIARLPLKIREELNRRLLEGETAKTLLPWLNSLPEASGGQGTDRPTPFSEMNLSRWRSGPYQDWLRKRERLAHIKSLSEYASKLAEAGGGTIAAGAMAIASGQILDLFETIENGSGQALPQESLIAIASALQKIQAAEQSNERLNIEKQKVAQKEQELEILRHRAQRVSLKLFLTWRKNQRMLDIADGSGDNTEKIEKLGHLIFGEDWRPEPEGQ